MTTVKLPNELEKRLSDLARETHKSKGYYIEKAVAEYLDDLEDYNLALAAMERYERGEEKTVPFEAIEKKYKKENDLH
jgi:RHH-type rel operon transcriptional repressor/antitoxin RelB